MIREILVGTGDRLAARQVLRLEIDAIGGEDEPRFSFGSRGAVLQGPERLRGLPRAAGEDVDIAGLEDAAEVGFVRCAGAQSLDRCILVAEGFKEGIRETRGIEGLICQLRNGLFYFNGVQLRFLPALTASVMRAFSCVVLGSAPSHAQPRIRA